MSTPKPEADRAATAARLETAATLERAGRGEEALNLYRRIWAEDPGAIAAGAKLAEAAIRGRRAVEAVAFVKAVSALDPLDFRAMELERELGILLYSMNYWEDAAPLLARAARREPWDRSLAQSARRATRPDWLAPTHQDPVAGRSLERYGAREGGTYIYTIDIVGTCNLRCPTCPVGNSQDHARGLGFMPVDMFARIVEKILGESPAPSPQLNLFNWGEPLLHPELPAIIDIARKAGLPVHLSTNLNIKRGLREVIAANPESLKISLSGFSPQTYGRSHKRGDLDLVKENMRLLRQYLDETGAETDVWVGQHIYKSNRHELAETESFVRALGFGYFPTPAYLMPVERVIDHLAGRCIEDDGLAADLLTPPRRHSRAEAEVPPTFDCELRFNQTVINHDGTVALCCSVYESEHMLGLGFLDRPHAEIEALKYENSFCETCRAAGQDYAPRPRLGRLDAEAPA